MDRNNRDARRSTTASTTMIPPSSNGLTKRRHRTSLRDSPEDDGPLELPDTLRNGLRDRHVGGKKDRGERIDRLDRLDRDRDRDRERMLRNKRRRGDGNNNHRSIHHGGSGNRGDELGMVADESSEESVNDNEEDDEDELQHMRLLQPSSAVPSSASSALPNHSRRSYPPSAAAMGAAAAAAVAAPKVARPVWKVADEMIGVSVPRKARSVSTKRSHDCWVGGGVTASHASGASGDQALLQPSTSPVRPGLAAASPVNNRPASPSSSNASTRKKLKPNGPKQRPPKSVSKAVSSSATQDEIEIAEVLYGMNMTRQPQGMSSKSEVTYGVESVKMEVSPDENSKPLLVSNSGSVLPPQNSSSSVPMMSAVAPKRKKPRQIKYDDEIQAQSMYPVRNSPILAKLEMDSMAKNEVSPSIEKRRGSGIENGGAYVQGKQQGMPVLSENALKMEGFLGMSKREESTVGDAKEFPSLKKESGMLHTGGDVCADGKIDSKRNPADSEAENHREEKFQIDLMAPPSARSSPERDFVGDLAAGLDQKSIASNEVAIEESEKRAVKAVAGNKEGGVNTEDEGVKREVEGEGSKSGAVVVGGEKEEKGVSVDMHLDVERGDGSCGGGIIMMMGNPSPHANASARSKGNQPGPKQQPLPDKSAPTASSLTFPISVAGWPGGLPPMGYMPPLPGVVSMDGSAVAPGTLQSPQLLFSQPRPKRCATHCYIARNISYHQQMARIPLWPAAAAAGSVSLYGAKPCNVNMMPSADPNGNASTRNVSALPEKGQNFGLFPGHSGKDKASPATNNLESQRKPILLQQAIPPGAPSNILHGPAFIFPLSQQQAVAAAAAASIRSGPSKSTNVSGAASAPSAAVGSASASSSATAAAAMSFSYPNMPGGETQYLAILQNNSYPFPVPAHVGAVPPSYRGTHPQAMPFLNGPFYSSQVLHPSQLQQQVLANLPQMQQGQGHQNASNSSGSSTSLKHLQSHQQRPTGGVGNGYGGSLQGFPSGKNEPSPQTLALQQQSNQHPPHHVRPLESEATGEDSPSTADSRIPRANMTTIYGQNFTVPMHAPNFTLMTQAPAAGANGGNSNNPSEKQQHPQSTLQHQGSKQSVIESLQSPAFAMSFTNMGSSASAHALDMSSFAQSHAVLQSLPEATRQTYQIMAAAAAAAAQNSQQKKNVRVSDDGKVGGNDASTDNDRKPLSGKSSTTAGHSIAFSRPDLMDTSVSSLPGSSVVDSSIRTLNLGSGSSRAAASVMPALVSTNFSAPSPHQLQRSQQQMIQLQKQHQFSAAAAAATRSKTPATSNGSVYSDHLAVSTSAAAKYPSSLSSFPQNFIQSSSGQTQSQWRGSTKPATSSMPSSLAPATATSSSLKLLSQQPVRVQQGQTHISFANSHSKSGTASLGQQQIPASNQQSPSPPVVVGSPTTSAVSKSAGGSPRTTSSSTGNKPVQAASPLQMQQAKNSSQSLPAHKSSSAGNGNVPSILGNSPLTSSSGPGTKHQLPQQQLSKQTLQQAQLFFSHPYVQVQAPHLSTNSASTVSATNAYYMQRRPSEQQSKLQQHSQGSASSSSSAMLSLCPSVTLANSGTCDPVKAVTVNNMKGSNLQSQGILHAAQFAVTQSSGGSHQIVPAGFSYVHAVPNAVQVKPADQKQPAGGTVCVPMHNAWNRDFTDGTEQGKDDGFPCWPATLSPTNVCPGCISKPDWLYGHIC